MTDSQTLPKYDVATVEAVLLEVAVELHLEHFTDRDLSLRIVSEPGDDREVETVTRQSAT